MDPYVIGLEDVGKGDVAVAGGKGANLGELIRAGFPVPPGFVVSARVCRDFFLSIDLHEMIGRLNGVDAKESSAVCEQIRRRILGAEPSPDIVQAVLSAYDELRAAAGGDVVCAVRSSATAEDAEQASFAGQHETYYYVGRDRLVQMIQYCWASLWRPEAVSYRRVQGVDHDTVYMAVVVQEMILSDVSGITFSVNPVTGDPDEIVTDSSWGMGAAIVDGRVTPDHYVVSRSEKGLKEKRVVHKRLMVPPVVEFDDEIRLVEVPYEKGKRESLTDDQAEEISAWAVKAEEHFGAPQDLEWAMAGGRLFLLQSRPVTIAGPMNLEKNVEGKWVIFKPAVENFTDPLSPLMCDLMSRLLPLVPGLRMIKGWLYMDIEAMKKLLPFKATDREIAHLLYDFGQSLPKLDIAMWKAPISLMVGVCFHLLTGIGFARTVGLPVDFMDSYRKLAERVDRDDSYDAYDAMIRLWSWPRFFDPMGHTVVLVNLVSGQYMFLLDVLRRLIKRWAPGVHNDAEAILCSGTEGVYSADMGREIWHLARAARQSPELRKLFEEKPTEDLMDRIRRTPGTEVFVGKMDAFLGKNGHRGIKELELRSQRWEENPIPVLGMIRNYMLLDSDPGEQEWKIAELRRRIEIEIQEKLDALPFEKALKWRRRIIQRLTTRIRYFIRTRENSRFFHIMGMYIARRKILRSEARLMRDGLLKCKDDIFFLTLDEVKALEAGRFGWRDVEDRIHARRMEYVRLNKTTPPKTIGIEDFEPATDDSLPDDGRTMSGQPASPGRYEGTAHVIMDPSLDLDLKPGEVLVAPFTDPAWTPLFLTAGAAVVEVGSYLSHAGTVAREYGMPCVVDVHQCTRKIRTGTRLLVDGDKGLVRMISNGPEDG